MSTQMKLLTLGVLAGLCLFMLSAAPVRAAGQDGMVIVKDPQTGKMRAPTPDELKALRAKTPQAALQGGTARPAVTHRTDGSHGVRLGEKSLVYEVVTRDADGKLTSQCVHGEDAVHDALTKSREHDQQHDQQHDEERDHEAR